jgi:DNA-binding MarR family transcriptional regulator
MRDVIYHSAVAPFSFLTNHGLALLSIAEDPQIRMRDIATTVDITERAAQRIVSDLIQAGYVHRTRSGRRNEYTVRTDLSVSLPNQRDIDLGSLLGVLLPAGSSDERRTQVSGL